MAQQGIDSDRGETTNADAGFPFVPVIISAVVLLALGALLLNLAISGSLPTGLGLGDSLSGTMVAGVDLDLIRGIIIVVILAVIAVGAFMALRNSRSD
jgi:hypothetical protein